jgi:hypothetical protein
VNNDYELPPIIYDDFKDWISLWNINNLQDHIESEEHHFNFGELDDIHNLGLELAQVIYYPYVNRVTIDKNLVDVLYLSFEDIHSEFDLGFNYGDHPDYSELAKYYNFSLHINQFFDHNTDPEFVACFFKRLMYETLEALDDLGNIEDTNPMTVTSVYTNGG